MQYRKTLVLSNRVKSICFKEFVRNRQGNLYQFTGRCFTNLSKLTHAKVLETPLTLTVYKTGLDVKIDCNQQ